MFLHRVEGKPAERRQPATHTSTHTNTLPSGRVTTRRRGSSAEDERHSLRPVRDLSGCGLAQRPQEQTTFGFVCGFRRTGSLTAISEVCHHRWWFVAPRRPCVCPSSREAWRRYREALIVVHRSTKYAACDHAATCPPALKIYMPLVRLDKSYVSMPLLLAW